MQVKTNSKKVKGSMHLNSENELSVILDNGDEVKINKDLFEDFLSKLNDIDNLSDSITSYERNTITKLKEDIINVLGEHGSLVDNEFNQMQSDIQEDIETIATNFTNEYIPDLNSLNDTHISNIINILNDRFKVDGQIETLLTEILESNYSKLSEFKPDMTEATGITAEVKTTVDQNDTEIEDLISHISSKLISRVDNMANKVDGVETQLVDNTRATLLSLYGDIETTMGEVITRKRDSDAILKIDRIKSSLYSDVVLNIFETMSENTMEVIVDNLLGAGDATNDDEVQDQAILDLKKLILNHVTGSESHNDTIDHLFDRNPSNFSLMLENFCDRVLDEKLTKLNEIQNNSDDIESIVTSNNARINGVAGDVFMQGNKLYKLTEEVVDGFPTGHLYSNKNSDRYIGSNLRPYDPHRRYNVGDCCIVNSGEVWESLDVNQGVIPSSLNDSFTVTEVNDDYTGAYFSTMTSWTIQDSKGRSYTFSLNDILTRGDVLFIPDKSSPYSDIDDDDRRILKVTYIGNESGRAVSDYFKKVGGSIEFKEMDGYWECLGPIRLDGGSPYNPITKDDLLVLPTIADNVPALYRYNTTEENEILTPKEIMRYVLERRVYPVEKIRDAITYDNYGPYITYSSGDIIIYGGCLYESKVDTNNKPPLLKVKRWRRIGRLINDNIVGAIKELEDDTGSHYYNTYKYGQETTLDSLNEELIGGVS